MEPVLRNVLRRPSAKEPKLIEKFVGLNGWVKMPVSLGDNGHETINNGGFIVHRPSFMVFLGLPLGLLTLTRAGFSSFLSDMRFRRSFDEKSGASGG